MPNYRRLFDKRLLGNPALIFSVAIASGYGGYKLGQEARISQVHELQRKLNDPAVAMATVLGKQLTWRPQWHNASGPRKSAVVSMFMPRFTGSANYILFENSIEGSKYILQTLQERAFNGVNKIYSEPTAGFYNGLFESPYPHIVVETAEKAIESARKLGKPITHEEAYRVAEQKLAAGIIKDDEYRVDSNLEETTERETSEEAGFNLKELRKDPRYQIISGIIGEVDVPSAYIIARVIYIKGPTLPHLSQLESEDEILKAEWVPLGNFNTDDNTVRTSRGIFPVKPENLPFTRAAVQQFRKPGTFTWDALTPWSKIAPRM